MDAVFVFYVGKLIFHEIQKFIAFFVWWYDIIGTVSL